MTMESEVYLFESVRIQKIKMDPIRNHKIRKLSKINQTNIKIYVENPNLEKPQVAMSEKSTMRWESTKLISKQYALVRYQQKWLKLTQNTLSQI